MRGTNQGYSFLATVPKLVRLWHQADVPNSALLLRLLTQSRLAAKKLPGFPLTGYHLAS
jgi:hypothetical protein